MVHIYIYPFGWMKNYEDGIYIYIFHDGGMVCTGNRPKPGPNISGLGFGFAKTWWMIG
jgi:hypothetical protein